MSCVAPPPPHSFCTLMIWGGENIDKSSLKLNLRYVGGLMQTKEDILGKLGNKSQSFRLRFMSTEINWLERSWTTKQRIFIVHSNETRLISRCMSHQRRKDFWINHLVKIVLYDYFSTIKLYPPIVSWHWLLWNLIWIMKHWLLLNSILMGGVANSEAREKLLWAEQKDCLEC